MQSKYLSSYINLKVLRKHFFKHLLALFLLFPIGLLAQTNSISKFGNIGIGTTSPQSLLHIKDGSLLIEGTTGTIPVSGMGSRLMWIPEKKAFRAGEVSGTQWDDTNVGSYSFAQGSDAIASGYYSISMGFSTKSGGWASMALGHENEASNSYTIAAGASSIASGWAAVAIGKTCIASNKNAVSLGAYNEATGGSATAIGKYNIASGYGALSVNDSTTASGKFSFAQGYRTEAKGKGSVATGQNTIAGDDFAFSGGQYSEANAQYSFAFGDHAQTKQYKPYAIAVGKYTEANGIASVAMGQESKAESSYSVAMGYQNTANETGAIALGMETTSSGYASLSSGSKSTASGDYAIALGVASATGKASVSMGYETSSNSDYATSLGNNCAANGESSFAVGSNISTNGWAIGEYISSSLSNIILGTGVDVNTPLSPTQNGLHVGFNSDETTLFVGESSGEGSTGNVGVGTTSPEAKLQVNTNEQFDVALKVRVNSQTCLKVNYDNSVAIGSNADYGPDRGLYVYGNVGIGTKEPQSKLAVNGTITAKEIEVTSSGWADFVFEDDYKLCSLKEVEEHIKEKGYLPDMPSAKEIEENGFKLAQMDARLLQKIEELTLYIIELEKRIYEIEKEDYLKLKK